MKLQKKKIIQISPLIWSYAPSKTSSRMSFIKMGKKLVMIDTGMNPRLTKDFRKYAEELTGLNFTDVLITHHHGDHTFGTSVFEDCEIISTKGTHEVLSMKIKGDYKDKNILLPTTTFKDSFKLSDNSFSILFKEVNGHTKGSAYVFIQQNKVLITGDILFSQMLPFGGDPTVDPYLWINALEEMIQLNPEIIIPGHGPITKMEELEIQKSYLEKLVTKIESLIAEQITVEHLNEIDNWPIFQYKGFKEWYGKMYEGFFLALSNK